MKALSIRQPWAWMILNAGKRVENRDWHSPPSFRGSFLLHSSAWWSTAKVHGMFMAAKEMARDEDWARVQAMPKPLTLRSLQEHAGKIIGRARLVGVVRNGLTGHRWPFNGRECSLCGYSNAPPNSECENPDGWAIPGELGFILADVERLASPIPLKGSLGFFDVPDSLLVGAEWSPVDAGEVAA